MGEGWIGGVVPDGAKDAVSRDDAMGVGMEKKRKTKKRGV